MDMENNKKLYFNRANALGLKLRKPPVRDFHCEKTFILNRDDLGTIDQKFIDRNQKWFEYHNFDEETVQSLPNPEKAVSVIRELLEKAKKTDGSVKVVIPKGIYILDNTEIPWEFIFPLNGFRDTIIDGTGAEFFLADPKGSLFNVTMSEQVILRGFAVDCLQPPHAQGSITKVDPDSGCLSVKFEEPFPDINLPRFRNGTVYQWALIKSATKPYRYKDNVEFRLYLKDWYLEKEEGIQKTYRFQITHKSKLKSIKQGDKFVQIARKNGAMIRYSYCKDVVFDGLKIYSCSAAVFVGVGFERVALLNCEARPRNGSWQCSGADGCFNSTGRDGIWMEGCYFEAIGDDCLILKGHYNGCVNILEEHEDGATIELTELKHKFIRPLPELDDYLKKDYRNKQHPCQAGDTLQVYEPGISDFSAEVKVIKVEAGEHGSRVTYKGHIPNLRIGVDSDACLQFFNNNDCVSGSVIINNYLSNAMRFGLLHKSNNTLIAGNTFHRFDVSAIAMQNTWQEIGELSQQVLILDNTFEYNGGWPTTTALTSPYQENRRRNCYSIVGASVNLARGQWNLDEYGKAILEGIYIEDNRFHNNWQLPGISFCNVVSGTIKGNTFSHDNNDPAYDDIINVRLHKCHTENLKIIDPGRIVITKSL